MSRERVSLTNYCLPIMDPLTRINNRRAFDQPAKTWSYQARRQAPPSVALLLFGLDRLKSINDRFGYDVGDKVITLAARAAEKMLRKTDKVFWIGGEEFVCLLPGVNASGAVTIAERLCVTFQAMATNVADLPTNATMSIGVAVSSHGRHSLLELSLKRTKLFMRLRELVAIKQFWRVQGKLYRLLRRSA